MEIWIHFGPDDATRRDKSGITWPPLPWHPPLPCRVQWAVVAEHTLLAANLLLHLLSADPSEPADVAAEAAEARRREHLRGVHGLGTGPQQGRVAGAAGVVNPSHLTHADDEPRPSLTSVYPASGPCASGGAVTIRGERLGLAISRGEITLRLTLPGAGRRGRGAPSSTVTLSATFVSERKLSCVLPPCETAGVATLEIAAADAAAHAAKPPKTPARSHEMPKTPARSHEIEASKPLKTGAVLQASPYPRTPPLASPVS